MTNHVIVGTAGHIDHGKSTLVRALTGIDPDRLKEEKTRGITIDLGFAHLQEDGVTFAFVDVPGHERFVKNMLAGASGIDLVLLVVAADESVMPQTREHFDICRLLGVHAGVVVLTKADLVDAETLELVTLEVRELVAGSFLAEAPVLPVSSRTGAGLARLREELKRQALATGRRRTDGPARLPIDRVFSVRGFGTVVTGTLIAGGIAVDDELDVLPSGRRVKVRGLHVHNEKRQEAGAGERVAVNLSGVEVGDLERGEVLTAPGALPATRRLDVGLELLPNARALKHGARIRFHQGTAEILGRVSLAGAVSAPKEDETAGATLEPGRRAFARVRLERPVVVTMGDRYIVRAYSPPVTIGGGRVLDPDPPRGRVRAPATRARLRRLLQAVEQGGDARQDAVAALVEERGAVGLPLSALRTRAGAAEPDLDALALVLERSRQVTRAGDVLVVPAVLGDLTRRLVTALEEYHRAHPLSEGMPREEARERLFGRAAPPVFDRVLADLSASGRLVARERLALATHGVVLTDEEQRARDRIERMVLDAGLRPPDAPAIVSGADVSPAVADRVIKLLVRQRVLVRLDTLLFHARTLEKLKAEIRSGREQAERRIDVGTFKEQYGVTRKFAIPLLEYLDRERVTRRVGEGRVVL